MNNKKMLSAVVLSLMMGNAVAALNTPIGSGTVDGSVTKSVKFSLAPMLSLPYAYDIVCSVTDPTGSAYPAVLSFDVNTSNLPFPASGTLPAAFDGRFINVNQAKLVDNSEHRFSSNQVVGNTLSSDASVTVGWVNGDDNITPITVNCYFTPSVGKK